MNDANVQKNVSNVILSRKPKKKSWSLLVKIVVPAAIVSLIILVGFSRTRSGAQLNAEEPLPQSNENEGSPANENNAGEPPPKSNNSETSPAYEDNAN